jgi:hypothetical protein
VRHYIALINYSWASGDGRGLRAKSSGCRECESLGDAIDMFADNGGYQRGGDWEPKRLFAIPTQSQSQPVISASISVKKGTWRRSSEDPIMAIKPSRTVVDFHVRWIAGAWTVTDLDQS